MNMNKFETCYELSIRTLKLQAVRIAEELKHGKTERAKELAREYEVVSAEYWHMKEEFATVGALDAYESYEDEKISNLI